jgi:hypothetical protein
MELATLEMAALVMAVVAVVVETRMDQGMLVTAVLVAAVVVEVVETRMDQGMLVMVETLVQCSFRPCLVLAVLRWAEDWMERTEWTIRNILLLIF